MMPKKKRESKSTFELTQDAYRAIWLGGDAFRDLFGKDWRVAWGRLAPALTKRNPIVWYNSYWDLSPNIPAGLQTPDPLDWGDAGDGLGNLYETVWVRRAGWLLRHPDVMSGLDWTRFRSGSKAKYLRQASEEDA